MKKILILIVACLGIATSYSQDTNPFVGRWALTIPGGGAGWLGVTRQKNWYDATILWGGGSVVPVDNVFFNDEMNTMFVMRSHDVDRRGPDGKLIRKQRCTEVIIANVDGDDLRLKLFHPKHDGIGFDQAEFTGKRIPPLPPKPDLSKLKFGDPIVLFNGKNLDGWRLTDQNQVNGWRVENGELINDPVQEEGKPHKNYGNLRTEKEFEDFNLQIEVNVPPKGNSGIYLRGIYEVQVTDSYGKPLDPHNMGAIYSRITPVKNAEKPAGEWQKLDITLCDRHVTVILNGEKIIDNEPLMGCTGGALWSDEFRPGPIYLQGDHTGIRYRNIVLKPIIK